MNKDLRKPITLLEGKKDIIGAEIGVAKGKHAKVILSILDIKKLYLIDSYIKYKEYINTLDNNYKEAVDNLSNEKDKIVWLIGFSNKVVDKIEDNELDFVYIDGNHSYKYVKQDILLYTPKVKKGGLIAGHDYGLKDVNRAVKEIFKNNFEVEIKTSSWWSYKQY